jgi:enoyl-CoA hydratase/carnithine racemase
MATATREHLLVGIEPPGARITLNRPEKRNALALDVMVELTAAVREVGDSDALGVILAANGPVFSAGHNFGDMRGATLADARHLFQVCTEMMDAFQEIPQPVVAKVHALATAAGCQLVASCDLAVASEDAAFAIPGGKGGLFCHTPLVAVARNIGRKRALEMAFTGDAIDARTAEAWGLVNAVVPASELDAACLDLLGRATRGSRDSKAMGKQGFYTQSDLDQTRAYAYAIELMAASSQTRDARERMAAFLEKRAPRFD